MAADLIPLRHRVQAQDAHFAGIGGDEAVEEAHGGGLSGAIGAQDAEDFAGANLE
ncbi:hypothetical protein D3C80_2133150 [compost metagenome]